MTKDSLCRKYTRIYRHSHEPIFLFLTDPLITELLSESGAVSIVLQNPRPPLRVIPVLYNWAAVKIPGVTMANLDNALRELRGERIGTQLRLEKLNQLISTIESLNGSANGSSGKSGRPTRIVSAASRRKMALAQRARWANMRKQSPSVSGEKTSSSAPAKRTMSASARKKIAAAQRARWAKLRSANKKAA